MNKIKPLEFVGAWCGAGIGAASAYQVFINYAVEPMAFISAWFLIGVVFYIYLNRRVRSEK